MLLTEEQARKKLCPNTESPFGALHCVASKCMAWRWYAAKFETEGAPDAVQDDYENSTGYCGLAGKVEG